MTEYDSPKRKLTYPLQNALVFSQTTEDDDCPEPSSSFVWPADSDERVLVPFMLSLNEYNVLASAIDVGSDIAYGADALRVVWLWQRNMRCEVSLCDQIATCIEDNEGVRDAILELIGGYVQNLRQKADDCKKLEMLKNDAWTVVADFTPCIPTTESIRNELLADPLFLDPLYEGIPPNGNAGNVYSPIPSDNTAICNAAAYIVGKIRDLIVDIFADLATIDPDDILDSLLGQQGWSVEALYQLITTSLANLENEMAILAEFDAEAEELKCRLNKGTLDQAYVVSWIEANYASNPVLRDMLKYGIEATAKDGRWAQWITIGALQAGADCSDCDPDPNIRLASIGFPPDFIELIDVVDDTDEYKLKTQYTGNYLTGGAASVGLVGFYITDVEFDPVAVGPDARFVLDFGTFELDEVPCYRATSKIWIYNALPSDNIRVFISPNPCPVWEPHPYWPGTNDIVQTATSIHLTLKPAYPNTQFTGAMLQYGLKFQIESISNTSAIDGFAYYNAAGADTGGVPTVGTIITGFYGRSASNLNITITGHLL